MKSSRWCSLLLIACVVSACASTAVPNDGAAPVDAANACLLPNGSSCPRGTSCPAGDGCNTCTCDRDGHVGCTLIACARICSTTAECPAGQECSGPPGCDVQWTCQHTLCSSPMQSWCDCAGVTYTTANGCATRPFVHEGPCETPVMDAGTSCAPNAATCRTGADCCSGYCAERGAPLSACADPPAGMFGCGNILCRVGMEYCELTFSDVPTPDSATCRSRATCGAGAVTCDCVSPHPCGGCEVRDANTVSFRCPGG